MRILRKIKSIKRIKKLVLALTLITIIFGYLEYFVVKDYHYNLNKNDANSINRYEEEYEIIVSDYRMIANIYYKEIIEKENVLKIFKEAKSADKQTQDKLRIKLKYILYNTYEEMVDNNFRQFQFVFDDGTSFLRMHKPEIYGDNLTDFRSTVKLVNETQKYVEGFEEGRIYNGYRFEYPLFLDGEYLGCVEASISFLTIIKSMDQLFNTPSFFLIKKSVVNEKVYKDQIANSYVNSRTSPDYYYDKEGFEYIFNQKKYKGIVDDAMNSEKTLKFMRSKIKNEENFAVKKFFDNKMYSAVFLKIDNVLEEQVGYLVFLYEDDIFVYLKKSIVIKNILILCLWLIIMFSLIGFYKFRGKIEKLTYFDNLTGVYNRNRLYEYIHKCIDKSKKDGTFSIMIFDIDHFKLVNDNFGHMLGDLVIKEVAEVVGKNIRKTDYLFRFGGDEFIILFPGTDIEQSKKIAEKIRIIVENRESFASVAKNITISVGVTEFKKNDDTETLFERADSLLYKAKETGRNKVMYK